MTTLPSSFLIVSSLILAGNQDAHKSLNEFNYPPRKELVALERLKYSCIMLCLIFHLILFILVGYKRHALKYGSVRSHH